MSLGSEVHHPFFQPRNDPGEPTGCKTSSESLSAMEEQRKSKSLQPSSSRRSCSHLDSLLSKLEGLKHSKVPPQRLFSLDYCHSPPSQIHQEDKCKQDLQVHEAQHPCNCSASSASHCHPPPSAGPALSHTRQLFSCTHTQLSDSIITAQKYICQGHTPPNPQGILQGLL